MGPEALDKGVAVDSASAGAVSAALQNRRRALGDYQAELVPAACLQHVIMRQAGAQVDPERDGRITRRKLDHKVKHDAEAEAEAGIPACPASAFSFGTADDVSAPATTTGKWRFTLTIPYLHVYLAIN